MIFDIRNLKVNTRDTRTQFDIDVINEVLKGDCYRLDIVRNIIDTPKVIIDVGGHIGTFGLFAKQIWKDALLLAFEPNKVSYDLYCKSMADNGFTNYKIYNKAIAYNKSKTYLMDGKLSTGGGMLVSEDKAKQIVANGKYNIFHSDVQTITLEEVMKENDIESIDLAKWDCEGSEMDAYRMMKQSTRNSMKNIVGEYHLAGSTQPFDTEFEPLFSHLKFIVRDNRRPLDIFWAYNKKYNLGQAELRIK